jgi:hypothetical protein
MDFNTIGKGSAFYILNEEGTPKLEIGTLKEKVVKPANMYAGLPGQQLVDITVSVDGKDRVIPDVPVNVEIAQRGKETYTGSREAMLQAVDGMIARAQQGLDLVSYYELAKCEGEKMREILNPRYAAEKEQARTIEELKQHREETDKKLDKILEKLSALSKK